MFLGFTIDFVISTIIVFSSLVNRSTYGCSTNDLANSWLWLPHINFTIQPYPPTVIYVFAWAVLDLSYCSLLLCWFFSVYYIGEICNLVIALFYLVFRIILFDFCGSSDHIFQFLYVFSRSVVSRIILDDCGGSGDYLFIFIDNVLSQHFFC